MILDTNALSAFAEGVPAVVALAARAMVPALPVVVLGAYRFGIMQSRRKHDYERWLSTMRNGCIVLEITDETASCYAGIRLELKRAGTPIPVNWSNVIGFDVHLEVQNAVRRQ